MRQFASGPKRSYYGKGDIIVYRLYRNGNAPSGQQPVFAANVTLLIWGDSFWQTYVKGDNTGLIATDSMKNFVQRETIGFAGGDLEGYCRYLGEKFLDTYPQAEGAQVSAVEIPYRSLPGSDVAFTPSGPERKRAQIELTRNGSALELVEALSGWQGFRFLRLGGSAFTGFVRDQYTTLPDIHNRPLHMWMDVEWRYRAQAEAFNEGAVAEAVRHIAQRTFHGFTSGSIQQIIYQMGTKMLEEVPSISEIRLEANNRTWDTVTEQGDALGVYTEARPPFGCLALTMKR